MRMRRKGRSDAAEATPVEIPEDDVVKPRDQGPYDVSEADPEATYIDLGSLLVQPAEGLDLRLQVDEQSGAVMTVLLVAE